MRKVLKTSSKDCWVGGVFGGLGEYYDFDPTILRILFIILTFASVGIPTIAIYIVAWLLIPSS